MDNDKKRQLLRQMVNGQISKDQLQKQMKGKKELVIISDVKEVLEGDKVYVTYNKNAGEKVELEMPIKEHKTWREKLISIDWSK